MNHYKCFIIGSGPAGYTAAIYASRAGLNPILFEGQQPGGQLTITNDVENYPGYPNGIMGPQMMDEFKNQAIRMGADIRNGMVTKVDFTKRPYTLIIDDNQEFTSDSVIIATGASAKWLGLPSETKFNGSGVSACAVCDGFFYKGNDVAIVGGGDTACEEATYLAKICRKVYMIVRKDHLKASKAMQNRVFNTENIEVIWEHETKEILGDKVVNGVLLSNVITGEETKLDIEGFFVAIGHKPNTDIFKDYLSLDETGYIITKPGSTHTNIEGVFACGDVQDHQYRQAVTAAGTGCMAALDCERWLVSEGM